MLTILDRSLYFIEHVRAGRASQPSGSERLLRAGAFPGRSLPRGAERLSSPPRLPHLRKTVPFT